MSTFPIIIYKIIIKPIKMLIVGLTGAMEETQLNYIGLIYKRLSISKKWEKFLKRMKNKNSNKFCQGFVVVLVFSCIFSVIFKTNHQLLK